MIAQRLADRYEILEKIGSGGMGVVYRAQDEVLDRHVAVKVVRAAQLSAELAERFDREAKMVARLDHPAILPIYDYGHHGDAAAFLVMPLVEGDHLGRYRRNNAVSIDTLLDMATTIADALAYSHDRGIVHRDVKPENFLVAEEAGRRRVWVTDFGIARDLSRPGLTRTGAVLGTLRYASPEQLIGLEVDARSDVFSFGAVLWECLAGKPPFEGNLAQLVMQITQGSPPDLRELCPDLDPEVVTVVERCLEREPERRYADGGELANALHVLRGAETVVPTRELPTAQISAVAPAGPILVGRRSEMREIETALGAVRSGEFRIVLIEGEAGSGKSRLLDEVEVRARKQSVRALRGRFFEDELSFPYQGFCELIQDCFARRDERTDLESPADLLDLSPGLASLFPTLGETVLDVDADGDDFSPEDPSEIYDLLARTLIRLSGGRPLALLLDDLHGADPSIEALRYVIPRLGGSPVLMVATYRTEEVDRDHPLSRLLETLHGHRLATRLSLGPFDRDQHRELVEICLAGGAPSEELIDRLYQATRGNPFLTVELVRWLQDSDAVATDDEGRWSLTPDFELTTARLPNTIQDAVLKRVDHLPDEAKKILQVASVLGAELSLEDLEALVGDADAVDAAADRLVDDGIWLESRHGRGDRLLFASGLVRDVVYGRLPRRRRRRLHRRFAEHLEERAESAGARGRERWDPLLVHHFYRGDVAEKTVHYALRSAHRHLESFSPEEALRACRIALEFLEETTLDGTGRRGAPDAEERRRAEAHELLARALHLRGELEPALQAVAEADRIYETLGLDEPRVALCHRAASLAWRGRLSSLTRSWTERGIAVARRAGTLGDWPELLRLAATVANLRGDSEQAAAYLQEAEELGLAFEESATLSPGAEIEPGGRLVVALSDPPTVLEPALISTMEDIEILGSVFETLLDIDEEGHLVPGLAESWSLDPAMERVDLVLREDLRFRDGTPLGALEVKRSFEDSVRRLGPSLRSAFSEIAGAEDLARGEAEELSGVRVEGERQLSIRLVRPTPIYPAFLSRLESAVLRRNQTADGEGPAIGTGPFYIEGYDDEGSTDDRIELRRNPHFRRSPVGVDAVEFCFGLDAEAAAEGLRRGEFDFVRHLAPADLESLLRDGRWKGGTVDRRCPITHFAFFQTGHGARIDAELRSVLASALATPELVLRTLGRWARPATGLLPPGLLGHDADRRLRTVGDDEIRDLLGSRSERPPRIRVLVHPTYQDRYRALLEAIFERWRDLGLPIEARSEPLGTYLEGLRDPSDLDLVLSRWGADYPDPDSFFHGLFHSGEGSLAEFYHHPDLDSWIEEGRLETRPAERARIYRRLEEHLLDHSVLVPLFHPVDHHLVSETVSGVQHLAWPPYADYERAARIRPEREESPPKGLLRVPLSGRVERLEPQCLVMVEQAEVVMTIYETLTRDVDGSNIAPWLARRIEAEDRGRRYRILLRSGVRFHDGRPLTARDVRYSFERCLRRSEIPTGNILASIAGSRAVEEGRKVHLEGVEVVGDDEVTVELSEPVAFFPALLTHPSTAIFPEGHDPEGENILGTGPFRLVRFRPGELLELEANLEYWRTGLPRSRRLVFHFGVAPEEIHRRFVEGYFCVACDLFPRDMADLLESADLAAGFRESPRLSTLFLAFNRQAGAASEPTVRRRVVQALDRKDLADRHLGRLAVAAAGFIPPGLLGHLDAMGPRTQVSADGRREPLRLRAIFQPVFFGKYEAYAHGLVRELAAEGIELDILNEGDPSGERFVELERAREFDLILARWYGDYPDPDTFAQLLHREKGRYGELCGSGELDALIERGRVEIDREHRRLIYETFEETLVSQAVLLPLFYEQNYRFGRPELEGLEVTLSSWPPVSYEKLRIREP